MIYTGYEVATIILATAVLLFLFMMAWAKVKLAQAHEREVASESIRSRMDFEFRERVHEDNHIATMRRLIAENDIRIADAEFHRQEESKQHDWARQYANATLNSQIDYRNKTLSSQTSPPPPPDGDMPHGEHAVGG